MKPEAFTTLRYEPAGGVALITFNRAEQRNAWNGDMAVEYRWALHAAHCDPAVRVAVVTGAGPHFCVGADAGALATIADDEGAYRKAEADLAPFPDGTPPEWCLNHAYPLTVSVPVIAALNGVCAGAGFVVAAYADLRLAAADARIATSFARLGLPAEYGLSWLLPCLIGLPNAARLLYDGAPVSAGEAQRLGFVQEVVAPDALVPAALELAGRLARESSPESLRVMKRQLFLEAADPYEAVYRRSVDAMNTALRHPDLREGLAAFRERRRPDFLGSP